MGRLFVVVHDFHLDDANVFRAVHVDRCNRMPGLAINVEVARPLINLDILDELD
jgi:hypothetical protein